MADDYTKDMSLDFRIDRAMEPEALAMLERSLNFVLNYRRRPTDQLQSATPDETRDDAELVLQIASKWAKWCTAQVAVVPTS